MTTAQRINPTALRESGDAAVLTAEAQPAPTVPTSRRLPIASIRLDGGTQPRAALSQAHINDLADDLRAGAILPPIDVMYDGVTYWLFDGYHRLHAHKAAYGDSASIDVRLHQGSQADAQWASFAVNKSHGLRRTTEDKQRAIIAALRHPTGASRSNREIGRHLGVDDKTVGEWRKKLESTAEIPQSTQRTGADGRTIETANIGANRPMAAGSPEARRLTAEIKSATWGDRQAGATTLPKLEVPLRMAGGVEQERATWGDLTAIVREVAETNKPSVAVMRQAADMRSTHQKNKFYYDVLNAVRGRYYNRFDLADMCMAISTIADQMEAEQPAVRKLVPERHEVASALEDWLRAASPSYEQLQAMIEQQHEHELWSPMVSALMEKCHTVVGINMTWLVELLTSELAYRDAEAEAAAEEADSEEGDVIALEAAVWAAVKETGLSAQELRDAVNKANRSALQKLQQRMPTPYNRKDFDAAVNNVAAQMDQAAVSEAAAFAAAPLPKAIPVAALTARQAAEALRPTVAEFYEDGSSTWPKHAQRDMYRNAADYNGAFWRTCVAALTAQGKHDQYTPALLRLAIELLADELTPAESEPAAPAAPAQDDDRQRRLESYLWHIEYMLNSLDPWSELTGHSVDTLEAQRGLRKMRDITKREIAILNGEPVPAADPA